MMLAWSPPLVMMPCTRASGRSCWRMASSATKSWIIACSALTPRQGHDEACEARPKNSHFTLMMPRLGRQTWVPQRPWIIIAASTSPQAPPPHQPPLPGAALLRGSADDLDASREGQRREGGRDGRARAGARGGDHVVAAGVADVRQRVVFGHDRDGGAGARARDRRAERGGQAADPALHRGALAGQEVGQPARRLVLLEAQLGVGVDLVTDALELVREPVHRLGDAHLDLVERGL